MSQVVIGYSHYGIVHERFMQSLLDMIAHESRRAVNEVRNTSARGPYIAECRNIIVTEFLKTAAEWLLFLDIDMIFGPALLETLMASTSEERKIVAGFYLTHAGERICSSWLDRGPDGKLQTVGAIKLNDVIEVESVGMGGTLIHRSVFEAIPDTGDNWRWFGHDLIDGVRHGEDVTFCLRAKAAGFKCFGSGKGQMGHIKSRVLDISLLSKQSAG